ncbi:hypothetical protein [Cytobacillus sp. IB215665]|uniref:hypothetical protein n=1 Tax=Cytobacillus sp. IB215665 TaxID=3097357 RepID=UPI002A16CE76|nr:hypothetical protein [Cytobacillus sp. IB215665]MDX8365492.1 hypothetical protein [Cytobacillus sp. IB215665]
MQKIKFIFMLLVISLISFSFLYFQGEHDTDKLNTIELDTGGKTVKFYGESENWKIDYTVIKNNQSNQ